MTCNCSEEWRVEAIRISRLARSQLGNKEPNEIIAGILQAILDFSKRRKT